ncbi:MAG TPA: hypothetical protein VFQ44_01410 [Streptosporangiaceae bacterium]|nr:hypothetical protein [Streptosporangiaceae bacterium]
MSKADRNRQRAKEKIAQARALEARRKRRQLIMTITAAVVVIAAAATGIALAVAGGGAQASGGNQESGGNPHLKLAPLPTLGTLKPAPQAGQAGPEGVPIPGAASLASTATKTTGKTVDGIGCQTSEQTIFHIHAHLTVFISGSPRQIPAGIGIPGASTQNTAQGPFIASGTCFYWLHTHAADGIIHIESPVHRTYTLGNFFDEWGQPLGPNQVGPVTGHVTALYNGQVYEGNPRDIPLNAHAQIQLETGNPLVAPVSITWPGGL